MNDETPRFNKARMNAVLLWVGVAMVMALIAVIVSFTPSDVLSDFGSALLVIAFGGLAVAAYFAPAVIAYRRAHHNITAIAVLNAFAGWTLVAWAIALVWAFTEVDRT
jgi:hypothetical protein